MNVAKTSIPSLPVSKPAPDSIASPLQAVATAVEAVYADGFRDPGEIAADDVGASRIATALDRSDDAKRCVETPS